MRPDDSRSLLLTYRRPPVYWEARAAIDVARMVFPLVEAHARRRSARDASPIMVVPGFGANDRYTRPLRHYLQRLGYRAEGWGMGTNHAGLDIPHELENISPGWLLPPRSEYRGEGCVPLLCDRLAERVASRHRELREPITLIGWSLGGFLAREAARDLADVVNRVITLGSPVIGGPKYTAAAEFFRRRGLDLDWIEMAIAKRENNPIRQPITAIYSRTDAIVSWPATIDHFSENVRHIEVKTAHLGMIFNPAIWRHIVSALQNGSA